jgi:acyl-coenzyme A synthetase/AMP-(fatty) acid ligase
MQTTPQSRIDEFTQAKWWGEQTIYDLFVQAEKRSDHLALVDPANRATFTDGFPQRLTYGQLSQHIDALSDLYFRGGIRENDIVVIQLPNIIELPITYLALARLGAIVSPVPVQYGAHELNQAIEKLDPAAYVTVSNLKSQNLSEAHGRLFEQQCPVFSFAVPHAIAGLANLR